MDLRQKRLLFALLVALSNFPNISASLNMWLTCQQVKLIRSQFTAEVTFSLKNMTDKWREQSVPEEREIWLSRSAAGDCRGCDCRKGLR